MKRFNFLSVVVALVLMVAAVGCTTARYADDDYYSNNGASRIYIDDPYRGTIVLERDPVSGRYYEINSFGSRRYYADNYVRRYVHYDRNNERERHYNGRRDDDDRRNHNGYYRNNGVQQTPQPSNQGHERRRDEARRKILGN